MYGYHAECAILTGETSVSYSVFMYNPSDGFYIVCRVSSKIFFRGGRIRKQTIQLDCIKGCGLLWNSDWSTLV